MSFTFVAEIESPRPVFHWHTVKCEGDWAESDGDAIRPGFKFFNPERVWILHAGKARLLPDLSQWLWDALSYQGEDAYRVEREDASSDRWEDEYQCFDLREDDIAF